MEQISEVFLENGKFVVYEILPDKLCIAYKITDKETNKYIVLKISLALVISLENHGEPLEIFLNQVIPKTMLVLEGSHKNLEIELTSSNSFSGNVKYIMDENELEAIAQVIYTK